MWQVQNQHLPHGEIEMRSLDVTSIGMIFRSLLLMEMAFLVMAMIAFMFAGKARNHEKMNRSYVVICVMHVASWSMYGLIAAYMAAFVVIVNTYMWKSIAKIMESIERGILLSRK
jgi:hypothetical protein